MATSYVLYGHSPILQETNCDVSVSAAYDKKINDQYGYLDNDATERPYVHRASDFTEVV